MWHFRLTFKVKPSYTANIVDGKMVFCYQNCSDLLREKNCSSNREKLLKFEAEGREFAKKFEITRTIYSNSERSEQFLVTCSWRFLISNKLEQLEFQLF